MTIEISEYTRTEFDVGELVGGYVHVRVLKEGQAVTAQGGLTRARGPYCLEICGIPLIGKGDRVASIMDRQRIVYQEDDTLKEWKQAARKAAFKDRQ